MYPVMQPIQQQQPVSFIPVQSMNGGAIPTLIPAQQQPMVLAQQQPTYVLVTSAAPGTMMQVQPPGQVLLTQAPAPSPQPNVLPAPPVTPVAQPMFMRVPAPLASSLPSYTASTANGSGQSLNLSRSVGEGSLSCSQGSKPSVTDEELLALSRAKSACKTCGVMGHETRCCPKGLPKLDLADGENNNLSSSTANGDQLGTGSLLRSSETNDSKEKSRVIPKSLF